MFSSSMIHHHTLSVCALAQLDSYPLLSFSPLPGKIPTKVVLPYNAQHATNYSQPKDIVDDKKSSDSGRVNDENNDVRENVENLHAADTFNEKEEEEEQQHSQTNNSGISFSSFPVPSHSWARNQAPFIYVQQVILRSIVLPWERDLMLTDAFRGPLFEVFKLLEIINNHETNITLSNLCLHVDNIKRQHKDVLFPEYNCLVLSPANFWKQNIHNFNRDNCLLSTIFQHHVSVEILSKKIQFFHSLTHFNL
jgi:hypothetical protein